MVFFVICQFSWYLRVFKWFKIWKKPDPICARRPHIILLTYLLNILKQTTQNGVQEKMKNISPRFISLLIFALPQNSYFHIIFTILVLAQIRRIICWVKRIKGTQMNQFLYLSIQDCQT